MSSELSNVGESMYFVGSLVSPEAITASLQALLPTRHHAIPRHRFTVMDTFDVRVRRAGAHLTGNGVNGNSTLAWEANGCSRLKIRLKQPVSFAWDLPSGPLRQVLKPVIGVRRLLPQAEVETSGSRLDVLDDSGKTIARLRIESGRARLPTPRAAWQHLPTLITLTGLRGYDDCRERLARVVESRPGVRSCEEDLHGMALLRIGARGSQDDSAQGVDLSPTVRADVGARQIHQALLRVLVANEPGLRANLDTEFLHDFRVAVRRTRSLLRQIKHVFRAETV